MTIFRRGKNEKNKTILLLRYRYRYTLEPMPEAMKQVAVRMSRNLHQSTLRMAKREKETFGEFVRKSVEARLQSLSARWGKRKETE